MATVNLLNNGSNKVSADMNNVIEYIKRDSKTSFEGKKLVTGINCPAETAYTNMMLTKNFFRKTDGRMYYHLVQSFSPEECITPELAHKAAVEFAEKQFPQYECLVGTHVDRDHIHSHILFNSVSFTDGKKYHSDKNDIHRWRETSDEICQKYGLSVLKTTKKAQTQPIGTREYRAATKAQSWKINLMVQIEDTMKKAKTKKDFRRVMEEKGYQVTWTESRKNITYTTPTGKKCRDDKLHETKFLKEMMEHEFRIRAKLIGYQEDSGEEFGAGSQADNLRSHNGRELESTSSLDQKADRDGRSGGNQSSDGYSSGADGTEERVSNGLVPGEGTSLEGRDDDQRRSLDEGFERTGWEPERAICFGSEASEDGITSSNGQSAGADASAFSPSVFSSDIALGSLRLASDLADLTSPEPSEEGKPAHMDKKEWQKLAEKNEAHGIRMGGM